MVVFFKILELILDRPVQYLQGNSHMSKEIPHPASLFKNIRHNTMPLQFMSAGQAGNSRSDDGDSQSLNSFQTLCKILKTSPNN